MKHFILYSKTAPTTGNFGTDLMKAGRLDVTLHAIIAAFFTSNNMRNDVCMHLIFDGPPTPPRHLELIPSKQGIQISKKDLLTMIKKLLYKYKEGKKHEIAPGYSIEKKGLEEVLKDISKENTIFVLDSNGEDIRKQSIPENCAFVLGDHEGIPRKMLKNIKKTYQSTTVGPEMLFASQTIIIVHNELDRKSIYS